MLIVGLALRDLLRDRFFLFCNVAMLVGALLPFLVLLGVKNGVYNALIGELLSDPISRQIDTVGNASFLPDDITPIENWSDVTFMTPKVRSQFDLINVGKKDGNRIVAALAVPSGKGDPTLPEGSRIESGQFVLSASLARRLKIAQGDAVLLITQAEDRPRQLVLNGEASGILDGRRGVGNAIYLPYETLDLIEAFYDSYSIPEYGIEGQRDLEDRQTRYEGVRLFTRDLEAVATVQARLETLLDTKAVSRAGEIENVLRLGQNLDLALSLIAGCAVLGLGAAFGIGFWTDVMRKRSTLAVMALLGLPAAQLSLFPLVQAVVASFFGIVVSFSLFALTVPVAQHLFGDGLPSDAPIAFIGLEQGLTISGLVILLVVVSTSLSAWAVQHLDPASVLRSGQ